MVANQQASIAAQLQGTLSRQKMVISGLIESQNSMQANSNELFQSLMDKALNLSQTQTQRKEIDVTL